MTSTPTLLDIGHGWLTCAVLRAKQELQFVDTKPKPLEPNLQPIFAIQHPHRSSIAGAIGTTHTITQPRADVLVVVEDVVGVIRGLHVRQPVVDGVAVCLADAVGVFVAAEEVHVDAFAEAAEGGEELPRPSGVMIAEVLAGPP